MKKIWCDVSCLSCVIARQSMLRIKQLESSFWFCFLIFLLELHYLQMVYSILDQSKSSHYNNIQAFCLINNRLQLEHVYSKQTKITKHVWMCCYCCKLYLPFKISNIRIRCCTTSVVISSNLDFGEHRKWTSPLASYSLCTSWQYSSNPHGRLQKLKFSFFFLDNKLKIDFQLPYLLKFFRLKDLCAKFFLRKFFIIHFIHWFKHIFCVYWRIIKINTIFQIFTGNFFDW